jgi:hypothetical protein
MWVEHQFCLGEQRAYLDSRLLGSVDPIGFYTVCLSPQHVNPLELDKLSFFKKQALLNKLDELKASYYESFCKVFFTPSHNKKCH